MKKKYPHSWRKRFNNFRNKFRRQNESPHTFFQSLDPTYLLYRTLSFYGESWSRALAVLVIILLGFALIYTQVDFLNYPKDKPFSVIAAECEKEPEKKYCTKKGLDFEEGLRHSLATATFQNIEYRKPVTEWGETLIILEKVFAPIQAALLALAIRRRFMK